MHGNGAVGIALEGGTAMKIIITSLIALSLLSGAAVTANAFDAKSFYEQLERQSGN
jgi:hypothetical protein